MIAELRRLWQEAFGDSDAFLDGFFAAGFSPERCHFIEKNGVPVSALYWFDCELEGQKLAYLYAVATDEKHRGQGLARKLMTQAHAILKDQDYTGAILVPGSKELFAMYEKLGYQSFSTVREFTAQQGNMSADLTQIDGTEYACLRREYLPENGVIQEGAVLDFLQTYCRFYAGADFLMIATEEDGMLRAQELLGNTAAAPGILRALGYAKGRFRTLGNGQNFAMYLPLTGNCPVSGYFALALD